RQPPSDRVEDLHPYPAAGLDRRDHRPTGTEELTQIRHEAEVANAVGIDRIGGARFLLTDHAEFGIRDPRRDLWPQIERVKERLLIRRPVTQSHEYQSGRG